MKLICKAKPVRIRVVSKGKDNSTLSELKENFVINDILPLVGNDQRLVRWLRQINENVIADKISDIEPTADKMDKVVALLSALFFEENDCSPSSVVDIIDENKPFFELLSDEIQNELFDLIANDANKEILESTILMKPDDTGMALCEKYADVCSGDELYDFAMIFDDDSDLKVKLLYIAIGKGSSKAADEIKKYNLDLYRSINDVKNNCFSREMYEHLCQSDFHKQIINLLDNMHNTYHGKNTKHFEYNGEAKSYPYIDVLCEYLKTISKERVHRLFSFNVYQEAFMKQEYQDYLDAVPKLLEFYKQNNYKTIDYLTFEGVIQLYYLKIRPSKLAKDTLDGEYNGLSNEEIFYKVGLDYLKSVIDREYEKENN